MIRRSPAEYFLKFLVAHPGCYDDAYVGNVARELGLDVLGDWYLLWLRQRCKPPSPFHPEDNDHAPSVKFKLREQIEFAYVPDEAMTRATRLVMQPRPRETVETMMLSGAPNEAIVHTLQKRYQFRCDDLTMRRYKHYFWNIELLDSTEMRALLDMRHNGVLNHPSKEVKEQYQSLNRMRYTDARTVAAKLPHTPVMALVAQMNAGVMPQRMDVAQVVDTAFKQAVAKVALHTGLGSPQDAQMAQSYSIVADVMKRLKDTVTNPEDQLREDLHRISVATTPNKVPTIRALTAGNHTVALQPEPVSEEADDDTSK